MQKLIPKVIVKLRKLKGLNQIKLALLTGETIKFIDSIESGKKTISITFLVLFCNAVKISFEDFFHELEIASNLDTTVYVVNSGKTDDHYSDITPEQYQALGEKYTLEEFFSAFNEGSVSEITQYAFIDKSEI